jgi:hypothetical protein
MSKALEMVRIPEVWELHVRSGESRSWCATTGGANVHVVVDGTEGAGWLVRIKICTVGPRTVWDVWNSIVLDV